MLYLIVISGKERAEAFADAIEAAANDKTPIHKVSARVLTDHQANHCERRTVQQYGIQLLRLL